MEDPKIGDKSPLNQFFDIIVVVSDLLLLLLLLMMMLLLLLLLLDAISKQSWNYLRRYNKNVRTYFFLSALNFG